MFYIVSNCFKWKVKSKSIQTGSNIRGALGAHYRDVRKCNNHREKSRMTMNACKLKNSALGWTDLRSFSHAEDVRERFTLAYGAEDAHLTRLISTAVSISAISRGLDSPLRSSPARARGFRHCCYAVVL